MPTVAVAVDKDAWREVVPIVYDECEIDPGELTY
jgi:hypothetical protein